MLRRRKEPEVLGWATIELCEGAVGRLSDADREKIYNDPSGALKTLSNLSEREQRILRLRYGIDDGYSRTLQEIGTEYSLTRERVRQIEEAALARLRSPVLSHLARKAAATR